MSRCFPFPPPGYEKKARIEDTDLLTKVYILSFQLTTTASMLMLVSVGSCFACLVLSVLFLFIWGSGNC